MGLDVDEFGNLVQSYDDAVNFIMDKDGFMDAKKMVVDIIQTTESLEKDLLAIKKKAKKTDVLVEVYKEEVDEIYSSLVSLNVLSREIANRMNSLISNQLPF